MNSLRDLPRGKREPHGSAVLVVIVLLALVTLYGLLTVERLVFLQRGLRLVEQKQLKKFEAPAASSVGRTSR